MKQVLAVAGAAGVLIAASLPAAAQQTIRVASFTPEQAVGVQNVMIPWMEAVQAEVGDQVDLQGFWGGALGRDPFAQFDLVRSGVIDVAWILVGYTPGQFPALGVTELPFALSSGEECSVVGWRLHEEGLVGGLDGVHAITIWAPDVTNIFTEEPIDELADLEGMRLRTAGSTQALFVEAIGALPETLGSTEANEAMMRGTVDGMLQGWTGMNTFGSFEVTGAGHRVPLGCSAFLLLMNQDTWDGLPGDVQDVMMKHGGEGLARAGGAAYDRITLDIIERQEAAGYGVGVPDDATIDGYAEQYGQEVYDAWAAETPNGEAVLDAFFRLIEEYRAEG
ncbi:MAG: hypothetical protein GVY28_13845 [Alphaproteobacteria bacterium]|jgi:TRAP-type C4-dicarboxylate transport system substrate-binding protein|nr:hypothetical protein [Alphaproteobacteria bacterium]